MNLDLGYVFADPKKLVQALTHSSFVYENNLQIISSNERLEFLGDAVLEILISELLYNRYPKLTEGVLSKGRAGLVCESSLSSRARKLGLGKFLRLGKGEVSGGGAEKDSILSDALESIIGAIYLDGGLEPARAFVEKIFQDIDISETTNNALDSKSSLQEEIQKESRIPLVYTIIKEIGPAHQKEFTATVSHNDRILGTGVGKSKKEAETNAASVALKQRPWGSLSHAPNSTSFFEKRSKKL